MDVKPLAWYLSHANTIKLHDTIILFVTDVTVIATILMKL